jgi:acyl carrier protein
MNSMKRKEFLTAFFVGIAGMGLANTLRTAPLGITEKDIKKRIINVIKARKIPVDWKKFKWSWHLTNDMGMDSLDTVEFIMAVETEFNISIPDAKAERMTTLQKAVDYLVVTLNK